MKRIAYAEAVVGTDPVLADLIIEYATRLAAVGSADTVHVPAVVGDGPLQTVAMLLGPASQITMWDDGVRFVGDADDAISDLRRRIGGLTATIPASDDRGPQGIDDMDDLDGVSLPDE